MATQQLGGEVDFGPAGGNPPPAGGVGAEKTRLLFFISVRICVAVFTVVFFSRLPANCSRNIEECDARSNENYFLFSNVSSNFIFRPPELVLHKNCWKYSPLIWIVIKKIIF